MDRAATIDAIRGRREAWDIIVIGGGATGVGCALDAASRGYDVLLLEQHDLGKGTSSRSTKLIHGGVRYLRQGNIALVREALRERGLLLKNAPHVVHNLPFIIPCYRQWQKLFYGAGLKIYDALAGKYGIGRSRVIDKDEVAKHLPNVQTKGLKGGVLYYDAQFDDTRLLIDIAGTARTHGAAILNYAPVTGLIIEKRKVTGVDFVDSETGDAITAKARVVINAAGIFSDSVRQLADIEADSVVTYSQGIHLVFDEKFLPGGAGLMIPVTDDGRVLFCIPWNGHLLVGTTDTPVSEPTLEPKAVQTEIDFVLKTARHYLSQKPSREDVKSVFAGIRPLVKAGKAARTASLSRGHDLFVDGSGLVTITGGKWTTYRQMAEDAVNKAANVAGLDDRTCITADLPISAEALGIAESLDSAINCSAEEVLRAVRYEMARTVEDVLARRTLILFLDARAAIELAQPVAQLMAKELGRDENWIVNQVKDFKKLAEGYLLP